MPPVQNTANSSYNSYPGDGSRSGPTWMFLSMTCEVSDRPGCSGMSFATDSSYLEKSARLVRSSRGIVVCFAVWLSVCGPGAEPPSCSRGGGGIHGTPLKRRKRETGETTRPTKDEGYCNASETVRMHLSASCTSKPTLGAVGSLHLSLSLSLSNTHRTTRSRARCHSRVDDR